LRRKLRKGVVMDFYKEESNVIPVDGKNFVGIGKIAFFSNAEWNIPHLHFMVDKTASGNFEATLLEFGLVSWSEALDGSIKSLVKQAYSYILSAMEKTGFDHFINEVDNHAMDGYWRQYRKIDFSLARNGSNLSHDMDAQFVRALKLMISEETANLITKMATENLDALKAEYENIPALSDFFYTEIKAVA